MNDSLHIHKQIFHTSLGCQNIKHPNIRLVYLLLNLIENESGVGLLC